MLLGTVVAGEDDGTADPVTTEGVLLGEGLLEMAGEIIGVILGVITGVTDGVGETETVVAGVDVTVHPMFFEIDAG